MPRFRSPSVAGSRVRGQKRNTRVDTLLFSSIELTKPNRHRQLTTFDDFLLLAGRVFLAF